MISKNSLEIIYGQVVVLVATMALLAFLFSCSYATAAIEESQSKRSKKSMLTSEKDIYYESEVRLPPIRYSRVKNEQNFNYSISQAASQSAVNSASRSKSKARPEPEANSNSYAADASSSDRPRSAAYENDSYDDGYDENYNDYDSYNGEPISDSDYLDANGVDSAGASYGDEEWQAYDDPKTGK